MPQVVRVGDSNSAGGRIIGPGASTVFVNGSPMSVLGDRITPHPPCGSPGGQAHCAASTVQASATVFAQGRPVVFVGALDSCGHVRVSGSPNVIIGF